MSDSDIDLSVAADPNPIDGVTVTDGQIVFLQGNTDATENGLYDAVDATDPTTWTRITDFDEDAEFLYGAHVFVREGTTYGNTDWHLTSDNVSVGVDDIIFVQHSEGGMIQNANLSIQAKDEGTVAGDARGPGAFDGQTSRAAANQVASGARAITLGQSNRASGANSVAIGNLNSATNTDSHAYGRGNSITGIRSFGLGSNLTNATIESVILGRQAMTILHGELVHGHGVGTIHSFLLSNTNLNSSAETELFGQAVVGNRYVLSLNTGVNFNGIITIQNKTTLNITDSWEVSGTAKRKGGTVVMDSLTITPVTQQGNASVAVEADAINAAVAFKVTVPDASATNIFEVGVFINLQRFRQS